MRGEIPITVLDASGNALIATATVYNRGTINLAAIYQAETGGATFANPVTTTAAGRAEGWLERGAYEAVLTAAGMSPYTVYFDISPAADSAIDTAWIAPLAVTGAKIAAGTVADANLASGISISKLAGYPSDGTKFLKGDGTWVVSSVPTTLSDMTIVRRTTPIAGTAVFVTVSWEVADLDELGAWSAGAPTRFFAAYTGKFEMTVISTSSGTTGTGEHRTRIQRFTSGGALVETWGGNDTVAINNSLSTHGVGRMDGGDYLEVAQALGATGAAGSMVLRAIFAGRG